MSGDGEIGDYFDCFGSRCGALVTGSGCAGSAGDAVALVRRALESWHTRFSRFLPASELSALNGDPRETAPVSPLMARFAWAVREAGSLSGGLVDATLLREIERAGYERDLPDAVGLARALSIAPARRPAAAAAAQRWRELEVDLAAGSVTRPPGLALDSGGLAKGLFADVLGETLADTCELRDRLRRRPARRRQRRRGAPDQGAEPVRRQHAAHVRAARRRVSPRAASAGAAGSGTTAHPPTTCSTPRLADPPSPASCRSTALAPSALEAEVRAKAAVLSGPRARARWLPHGGVIVFDDGSHRVQSPAPVVTVGQLARHLRLRTGAPHASALATSHP